MTYGLQNDAGINGNGLRISYQFDSSRDHRAADLARKFIQREGLQDWTAYNTLHFAFKVQKRTSALRVVVVEGDGQIPYTAEAAAKKKDNGAHWLDRDPEVRCYMPGIPRAMYMPYPFQIIQGTNRIQMVFAFANASRTIHLDKVNPPPNDTWMGHSVGRWEGDTLVVNVSHFNDRTWFSRAGDFHSDALRLEERFTPITPDALRYEVTVADPNVFTRPWKMRMVLYRQLEDNAQLLDYKCVELVEETFLGHLRREQLVKRWEGDTMIIEVTRKIPPAEILYQR
jgi:hypothetical protein